MSSNAAAIERADIAPLIGVQEVTELTHWTETLFSFRITRPDTLRFRSGEFVMIGLPGDDGRPLMRAYSIASSIWDEELEFYSIKVPDGPLTSRLQHIKVGDTLLLKRKPVGTLLLEALNPGGNLWLVGTGTGIAPFASIVRDPETFTRFDRVILTHTCREVAELAYGQQLVDALPEDPLVGEMVQDRLVYYPTTTRETSAHTGRITTLVERGQVFADIGSQPWHPDTDRVMICGSLAVNKSVAALCVAAGLSQGSSSKPGEYVTEKAFVG